MQTLGTVDTTRSRLLGYPKQRRFPRSVALFCSVMVLLETNAWGQREESAVPVVRETLQQLADRLCVESGSPGVWLAWGSVGELPEMATAGVRKHGEEVSATVEDRLHLGSCTKAMTAVLIARLVEQGRLNWSETLAGVVPEVAKQIPEAHRLVTLEQFLQHRSGFPANARDWWMRQGDEV